MLAARDAISTDPLVPDDVVPVEKESDPDMPIVPALVDEIVREPLDVAVVCPEIREIVPPDVLDESPATRERSPADSTVPSPILRTIEPDLPPLLFPLAINIFPEDPLLVVPEENDKCPLIPAIPPFTERNTNAPEVNFAPDPVASEIDPPVVSGVFPATCVITAPVPTSFPPPLTIIAL